MTINQKETMLNKVLQFENWLDGYLAIDIDASEKTINGTYTPSGYELLTNIKRNLNSIKSLIKKS